MNHHPSFGRVDRLAQLRNGAVAVVDARTIPIYPATEAARIIGARPSTLRSWFPPLRKNCLTFVQLVEAYVIQVLRSKYDMPMRGINKSRAYLKKKTGYAYPFAVENLGLQTDGAGLYFDDSGNFTTASENGQLAMRDILSDYLDKLEYGSDGLALRLYPFTSGYKKDNAKLVIVDPRVNFGRPSLATNSVSTLMIARRFKAGESRSEIADDYNCKVAEIDEAINQETARTAAA